MTGYSNFGRIPETEAVEYIYICQICQIAICPIAEVLKLSHEIGIVHRDAGYMNMMVANQTRAVLIDFGIAGVSVPDSNTHLS